MAGMQIEINEQAALLEKYGNRRVRHLHLDAIAAYNDDRFDEAVRLYRQALSAVENLTTAGRGLFLEEELATAADRRRRCPGQ